MTFNLIILEFWLLIQRFLISKLKFELPNFSTGSWFVNVTFLTFTPDVVKLLEIKVFNWKAFEIEFEISSENLTQKFWASDYEILNSSACCLWLLIQGLWTFWVVILDFWTDLFQAFKFHSFQHVIFNIFYPSFYVWLERYILLKPEFLVFNKDF